MRSRVSCAIPRAASWKEGREERPVVASGPDTVNLRRQVKCSGKKRRQPSKAMRISGRGQNSEPREGGQRCRENAVQQNEDGRNARHARQNA